jgi:hypothetical protein
VLESIVNTIIVAFVLSAIALIALTIAAIVLWRKRRRGAAAIAACIATLIGFPVIFLLLMSGAEYLQSHNPFSKPITLSLAADGTMTLNHADSNIYWACGISKGEPGLCRGRADLESTIIELPTGKLGRRRLNRRRAARLVLG